MAGSDIAREDVRLLDQRRIAAMVDADVGSLSEIYADELIYNHSSGGRDTKGSLLEKIASGYLDYLEIVDPEQEIVVVGHTAIVTGRMVARLQVGGKMRNLNNRTLSVWTLDEGRWTFLAFQPSAGLNP